MPYEAALLMRQDFPGLKQHLASCTFAPQTAVVRDTVVPANGLAVARASVHVEDSSPVTVSLNHVDLTTSSVNSAPISVDNEFGARRKKPLVNGSRISTSGRHCCDCCCFCVPAGMTSKEHGGCCAVAVSQRTRSSPSQNTTDQHGSCCTAPEDDLTRAHILRSLDYETNLMLNPQTVHYGHPAGTLAAAQVVGLMAGPSHSNVLGSSCPCSRKPPASPKASVA